MDFTGLDSAQPSALMHARRRATWQLAVAWGAQLLLFLTLWLSDNPQWVWYSLLRDGGWVGVLAALLVLGLPALIAYGLWSVHRERAAIWPAFVLPAVALVSGGLAASLAYAQTMDLAQVASVRESGVPVYAAAQANAQRILSVAFFVTAFLAQFAAPVFLARATVCAAFEVTNRAENAEHSAIARSVAAVASVLALIAGFGIGWSAELAIVVFSIVATSTLVSSLFALTHTPNLRCSSLGYVGLCLGVSQACFAASFLARARTKLFTFFDDPDFSADAVASFARVLEEAQVFTQTLPWLLLLPLGVVVTGLVVSGSPHFWRWTALPLLPFVVGAGSLVAEEPISDADMEQLGASKPVFGDKVRLPAALLGKPGAWTEPRTLVVATHEEVAAFARDEKPVVVQAPNLLRAPQCRTRLLGIKTDHGAQIAADTSLDTRELDCLLVGTLGLQTSEVESDGASGVEPASAPKLGFLLAARLPAVLAPYADALSHYTTVELGVAEQWGPTHVHVSADAWELVRAGQRKQLKGDLAERSTKLSAALDSNTAVSIDADPSLPIAELLNAALAAKGNAATRSVLKWISGVSGPSPQSNATGATAEVNQGTPMPTTSNEHASAEGSAPKNGYEDLVKLTTLPFEHGGLPHAVVDQVTRSRLWELGSCYKRLKANSNVSGSVELRIRIARNGLFDEMPALGRPPKAAPGLVTCARQALLDLRYPEASKGTPDVTLRIEFGG